MTIQLPVPFENTRFSIFTPRSQSEFLENLSHNGNVRLACRAGRVSPQTAYRARRKSSAFAALWDAALLSARSRAEEVLADRALNGVKEAVFYHGEEVATRTRYDSRLLLAHLARLDRLAERAEVDAALGQLDDAIASLAAGEELVEACRQTPAQNQPQDSVPCVPSCRNASSSSEAIGQTRTPSSSEAVGQTKTPFDAEASGQHDCDYYDEDEEDEELAERLIAMEDARPEGVKEPWQLAQDHPYIAAQAIEDIQLAAFEDGCEAWWLVVPTREEWLDEGPGEGQNEGLREAPAVG